MSRTRNASIPHAMELRGSRCKSGFPQRQDTLFYVGRTDNQEKFLVQDLEFQSCDSVAAVR